MCMFACVHDVSLCVCQVCSSESERLRVATVLPVSYMSGVPGWRVPSCTK